MVHHVVAFTNYYMAFWQQDFAVTVGAAFILLEISTPFVCLRWLYFHHGLKGSMIQNINTVVLFLLFVAARVIYQAYIICAYSIDWVGYMWFEKEGVSLLYKVILAEMALAVLINVVLNYYWTYVIVLQLVRIITRGSNADATYGGAIDDKKPAAEDNLNDESVDGQKPGKVEMAKLVDPEQPQSDMQP